MTSVGGNKLRRTGAALLATLLVFVCAFALVPAKAYAYYYDVSSQYPASRDLSETAAEGLSASGQSIYGGALDASQIISGTYVVPAYTSSRMCNFYASLEEATAKSNPNHASITVSGGVITATFYLSGAYTAAYFGSADQAAALAPADGITPSTSYITDGSIDGSVGHGPFTVQIGALNTEFDFAVFNGGTKGVEGALWYARKGAFIATLDFAQNYSMVDIADDDDEKEPGEGDGQAGGQGGAAADPDPEPNYEPNSEPEQVSEPEPQQQLAPEVAADPDVTLGKLITIASLAEESGDGGQAILQGSTLTMEGLTTEQIALLLAGSVALAGAVLFAIRYLLQLRTPAKLRKLP